MMIIMVILIYDGDYEDCWEWWLNDWMYDGLMYLWIDYRFMQGILNDWLIDDDDYHSKNNLLIINCDLMLIFYLFLVSCFISFAFFYPVEYINATSRARVLSRSRSSSPFATKGRVIQLVAGVADHIEEVLPIVPCNVGDGLAQVPVPPTRWYDRVMNEPADRFTEDSGLQCYRTFQNSELEFLYVMVGNDFF